MGLPYMTMAEVLAAFPDEWVVFHEPTTNWKQEVLGGYILYHGPDKMAAYAKVDELPKPFNVAVWYTGPLLEEDVIFAA